MASFFSKDFKSELTLGKITAKVLVALIVTLLAFSYEHISALILNIYKHLSQTLYDDLLESVASGPKDYSILSITVPVYLVIFFGSFSLIEMKRKISKFSGEEGIKKLDRTKYQDPKIRVNAVKEIKLSRCWYAAQPMCQAYQQRSPKPTPTITAIAIKPGVFNFATAFVYHIVGTPTLRLQGCIPTMAAFMQAFK